jgi:hypothetical protein
MTDPKYDRFCNVTMPRWYRITAWVIRIIGFLIFLVAAWEMTHQNDSALFWYWAGVLGGILLLLLPSVPKAYIEQRNRMRGLRDGSFKEYLEHEIKKNSSQKPASREGTNPQINLDVIPKDLHPLIPLVGLWSFSDDEERYNRIMTATPTERAEFNAVMKAHQEPLQEWLRVTDVTKSNDMQAIAWLDVAWGDLKALEKRLHF